MLRDNFTPFDGVENSTLYPPEMLSRRTIAPENVPIAREEWKKQGYSDEEIEKMLKGE